MARVRVPSAVRVYRRPQLTGKLVPLPDNAAHRGALAESEDDLEWHGAHEGLRELCVELGANDIPDRIPRWISKQ